MIRRDYIIVAGNIGTGKTSVIEALRSRVDGFLVLFERRDIFLERYYSDPVKYAFLNQLAFSLQYLEQAVQIAKSSAAVVQDRSIYDTHHVFSRMMYHEGAISEEQFSLLERVFNAADALVRPTLLVMLHAPVDLVYDRMVRRGVKEEAKVPKSYLATLGDAYDRWYSKFDRCEKMLISTQEKSPEEAAERIASALNP